MGNTTEGSAASTPTGRQGITTAEAGTAAQALTDYAAAEFEALRNALVHTIRQRWFDSLHRWLMFFIVLFGTTAAARLLVDSAGERVFAMLTAILATLDLVLDLRGNARKHEDLKVRYYDLLADIVAQRGQATEHQINLWMAKFARLTAEEPSRHVVVDCIAHNQALASLGRSEQHMIEVGWWHRMTANWFTYAGFSARQPFKTPS